MKKRIVLSLGIDAAYTKEKHEAYLTKAGEVFKKAGFKAVIIPNAALKHGEVLIHYVDR